MWDLLHDPLVILFGSLTAIAATAILSEQWRRVRELEIEAALKAQMIDRGLPAADIERIIRGSRARPAVRHSQRVSTLSRRKLVYRSTPAGWPRS